MSYVDRPRDDGAALNIDGSHRCADCLTVTTVTMLKVIVREAYRLRLVALMMGEMERKRKGGVKVFTGKVTALSANYRVALKMINAVVKRHDTFQMSHSVDFQLAIIKYSFAEL